MIKPANRHRERRASAQAAGLALILACLLTACGITAPRHSDGYADLDSLGVFDTDRTMVVSIGPTLLRVAAWATGEDEPELAAMLRGIEGVRIRIYEIDGDAAQVASRIRNMSRHLQAKDWQPVMLIKEDGEQTSMLMRTRGERILGLTLLTSDEREAVVINVMGNLDPAHFSEAMVALDVDVPEVSLADASTGG